MNVYKTFVKSPQSCLNIIHKDLAICFIELFLKNDKHYNVIANNGIS